MNEFVRHFDYRVVNVSSSFNFILASAWRNVYAKAFEKTCTLEKDSVAYHVVYAIMLSLITTAIGTCVEHAFVNKSRTTTRADT